jgi:rhodanese-related sulfurtransferase
MLRELCIIALLTALGSAFSLYHGLAPLPWAEAELEAGEIRLVDAQAMEVIWLDTRDREDFEASHIPEALFFSEAQWDESLIALMEAWLQMPRPIIVYCGSRSCDTSQRIAELLRESLPEAEIYSLKGGWEAWHK